MFEYVDEGVFQVLADATIGVSPINIVLRPLGTAMRGLSIPVGALCGLGWAHAPTCKLF